MKRLFLAVDPDPETRKAIGEISAALRERMRGLGRLTWVAPDRMHLTLHFLGEADEQLERRALAAVDRPVPATPFKLSFDGLGFFPPRAAPRVLWLGIDRGLSEIQRLRQELMHRVGPAGHAAETFHPHLTLARVRERIVRGFDAKFRGIPASAGPCPIDRVTLYESCLSSVGPSYRILGQALLKP